MPVDTAPRPRLLPVPRSEPACEEQRAWTATPYRRPATQGTLALAFTLPSGAPAVPPAPRLAAVPDEDDEGPRPTPTCELPDPAAWSGRYVQAALEVLAGERPVTQLVRWTSARVYADLQRRALAAGTAGPGARRGGPRCAVRSVHVGAPADGVAEVCAVVARAGRVHAVALRLEGLGGRWRCTALQVG
ncbi:Rv3235 family protein [Vallicoccus soli]|uniref:Uncharacterized protein n=1 Tax=Vallicoccus soli TaxID=2339232 RepID=A0A3A3YYP0_9ACTN|nr:Rv3235 family protein [Vallicoccus soli]RJK95414.1 hypothetical protein D5H78_12215 [Vallicoccus soli]